MNALVTYIKYGIYAIQYRILAGDTKMDMDPFSYLNNNKVSDNGSLQKMGASLYRLLIAIGAIGVVLTIIISGLLMMLGKGNTRQDGKSRLSVISVVCIAIFSFVFLAGEVLKVANNFT